MTIRNMWNEIRGELRQLGDKFYNGLNHIRIKRYAKRNQVNSGRKQILLGGVWMDSEHNIYNCLGKRIGKVTWFEDYES